MKLEQLAAKPKLIKILIDSPEVIEEFGEEIEFYTWDRQPMNTFIKLAAVDTANYATVMEAVKELVLNEQGQPIITDTNMLPAKVLMLCINKIIDSLGKS